MVGITNLSGSKLGKYNLINWDEGKFKAMVNGDNGNVTTVPDIMYPDQYWEVIGQNLSVMKTILVNTIRTGPIQWYVCDTCLPPRFFLFNGYQKIIWHNLILNLAEEHNNVSCDLDDLVLQSHIWHLKIISWFFYFLYDCVSTVQYWIVLVKGLSCSLL